MSDNVKRDNRRALPKYLLTILLCGLLGGVLGFFTGVAGAAGVAETVRQALDRALEALGNLPSCNQEGLGLRADILRRMGDLEGAARLEKSALAAQLAALDHTLTSFAATRRAQGLREEAERLEQQARRLKELFGAPAAPAGCCCECEGEASE